MTRGAPPVRRSRAQVDAVVLAVLAEADGPLGAYAIAERTAAAGHPTLPAQVYRTLARLVTEGAVCRVPALRAYALRRAGADAAFVCDGCHAVAQFPAGAVVATLKRLAGRSGFAATDARIEVHGRCPACEPPTASRIDRGRRPPG